MGGDEIPPLRPCRARLLATRQSREHWRYVLVPSLDVDAITAEYFDRIHRAALVMSGNPWDADDLAQETFMVMARQPDRFEGRSSVYTWLYGILLNLDRRERRRKGTHHRKLSVLWEDGAGTEKSTPAAETSIEVEEWKRSLWSFVAQLGDGQRQALILRFSQGLRYDEVAEILDCPLGTVKSRIFNGLAALREMIGPEHADLRFVPEHPTEDISRVS
jgi:RNA polymerase sigma-70 factor (ECF subfamily)